MAKVKNCKAYAIGRKVYIDENTRDLLEDEIAMLLETDVYDQSPDMNPSYWDCFESGLYAFETKDGKRFTDYDTLSVPTEGGGHGFRVDWKKTDYELGCYDKMTASQVADIAWRHLKHALPSIDDI